MERLTLVSALSVGHPFTLYSYTPEKLRGVPNGVEVRDANEVVPYRTLARYFDGGWAALGTDFFRYAMQAKGLGTWADLDLYFIRPIDFHDDYVFSWEHEKSINGAVLRLPPNSDMVRELCEISHLNWRPPFYGPRKTAVFYWRRLTEGDIRPENYRWGTFGPMILTYLAKKHRVSRNKPRSVPSFTRSGTSTPKYFWVRQNQWKPTDERHESGPSLEFRIEPDSQGFAAAWLLP